MSCLKRSCRLKEYILLYNPEYLGYTTHIRATASQILIKVLLVTLRSIQFPVLIDMQLIIQIAIFLLLLFLVFACQGCEIELSSSNSPLVKIDDIADLDGVFYVDWAPFVKTPQCVSNIEIRINNKSSVTKSCDCAGAPPESKELQSYLDRIRVSQPPGGPSSVCKVTELEARLTNIEGNMLSLRRVVDPVKDLFDASKEIQVTRSEKGIDIHWMEGGMLAIDKLKEECLESVDVYNGDFRIMHQITPDNPVILMQCTGTMLTFKYNFHQNPRQPEMIFSLPSECTTDEATTEEKTAKSETTAKTGDEDTTETEAPNHDAAEHRKEQNGKKLSPDSSEDVPAASNTIMIGSVAACAVVIPTLLLVGLLVVKRRAESNQHSSQVQEFHFLSHMIIHSKLTPPSCRFNYEMGRT